MKNDISLFIQCFDCYPTITSLLNHLYRDSFYIQIFTFTDYKKDFQNSNFPKISSNLQSFTKIIDEILLKENLFLEGIDLSFWKYLFDQKILSFTSAFIHSDTGNDIANLSVSGSILDKDRLIEIGIAFEEYGMSEPYGEVKQKSTLSKIVIDKSTLLANDNIVITHEDLPQEGRKHLRILYALFSLQKEGVLDIKDLHISLRLNQVVRELIKFEGILYFEIRLRLYKTSRLQSSSFNKKTGMLCVNGEKTFFKHGTRKFDLCLFLFAKKRGAKSWKDIHEKWEGRFTNEKQDWSKYGERIRNVANKVQDQIHRDTHIKDFLIIRGEGHNTTISINPTYI